jgi:hypothetical protein
MICNIILGSNKSLLFTELRVVVAASHSLYRKSAMTEEASSSNRAKARAAT